LEFFIKLYVFFYIMLEMDTIIFHDNWDLCMLLNEPFSVYLRSFLPLDRNAMISHIGWDTPYHIQGMYAK